MKHWLMKSEPDSFGIDDLARVKLEPWTGVRNFQARNHMRAMSVGDAVLFHHSSVDPPGVAGLARVSKVGVVDETQFDPKSKYYDATSPHDEPRWDCVEVEFVEKLPTFVPLDLMRATAALADMLLLRRGMRLSVQPVTPAEYKTIVKLGHAKPAAPKKAAAAPKKPARAR
jgi:predicted RNA-binding protein with PUA-like domain